MSASRRMLAGAVLAGLMSFFWMQARAADADGDALGADEIRALRSLSASGSEDQFSFSDERLRGLIRRAHAFSPLLRESQYAVAAAAQDVNAARGARLPQVTLTGASTTYAGQVPDSSKADGRPYLSLSATMPVYDFGRLDAAIGSREASREATLARSEQQANQVATEAVATCLEYTKQRALLFAADDYLQAVQKLVDMLTQIAEADSGRSAELVQARSRLLQAMQARENARSYAREFRTRLDRLLGPNQALLCDGIGPSFLRKPDPERIRAAIRSNPQVRASQFDYEAAQKQLDQVSASRKPQFQVSAAHAPVAAGINNDYYQSFSLSVSVPVFDGSILQSTERAALERASAAAERVDLTLLQADTDYRERFERATASLRRAQEYTGLLEVNDRVRKNFFIQWYSLGRRSLFELLAVEQEQYGLQQGYFTSLFDGMAGIAATLGAAGMLVPGE